MLNDTDRAWLEEAEARCNEYRAAMTNNLARAIALSRAATIEDIPRLIAMVRAGEQPAVVHCVDCFYGAAETKQDGYLDPPRCDGVYCFRFSHDMDFTDYCSCGKPKDGQRAGDDHIGEVTEMVGQDAQQGGEDAE